MRTIGKTPTIPVRNRGLILGLFCLIWVYLVFPGVRTAQATDVGGFITTDTVWTKAGSPYNVIADLFLLEGITLTIEPGVAVIFMGNFSIDIDGIFLARGTSDQKITFTRAPGVDAWGYIQFRNNSIDAVYDPDGNYVSGCIMEYCQVSHSGGAAVDNNGSVRMHNAHPFINRCQVQHSLSSGINAWDLSGTLKITNCHISNNQDSGIALRQISYPDPNPYGPSQMVNNTIIGNGRPYANWGGGISVNDSLDRGGVVIFNNLIKNNQAGSGRGGGIFTQGGPHDISKNIIRDNTSIYDAGGGICVSLFSGNISENVITGNTADRNSGGIDLNGYGDTIFANNIVSDNTANWPGGGISGGGGTSSIVNNSLIRNRSGTYSAANFYDQNFMNNLITGNNASGQQGSATMAVQGWNLVMNCNNIFGNTAQYELENLNPEGFPDTDAQNNWWGTTVLAEIINKVYDWHLDHNRAVVDYLPYLSALNIEAPISPPVGVTAVRVSNGLKVSWQANQEADLAGYIVYWGSTPGYPYAHSQNVGNVTTYTIPPPGNCYVAVTAYDTAYNPANDNPATLVNENQTSGHESWFSGEVSRKITTAWLLLLDE